MSEFAVFQFCRVLSDFSSYLFFCLICSSTQLSSWLIPITVRANELFLLFANQPALCFNTQHMKSLNWMSSFYGVYNTDVGFDFQINCLPNLVTLFIIHRFKEDLYLNPFQRFFFFFILFCTSWFSFLLLIFFILLCSYTASTFIPTLAGFFSTGNF